MRTNLYLLERAEKVADKKIDKVKEELRTLLDQGILNYPQTLETVGITPEMTLKEKKDALNIESFKIYTESEKEFFKKCKHNADQGRKQSWAWRISQEAQEKQDEGWYPFFITLTVDPKRADPEVVWRDSNEFRKYIRKLADIVCKELGHPPSNKPPYRPESNYVTYAGVVEHGKSRLHHHCHLIVWMRAIPASWRVCPNAGIRNPAARTRNECLPMRSLWRWSNFDLSPAHYFRS